MGLILGRKKQAFFSSVYEEQKAAVPFRSKVTSSSLETHRSATKKKIDTTLTAKYNTRAIVIETVQER